MINSPFKTPERENQGTSLTTLETDRNKKNPTTSIAIVNPVRLLAQTSAKYENAVVKNSYLSYPSTSRIYAYQLREIDQEVIYSHEIAVYDLAQPIGHKTNIVKIDTKERRGKFLLSPKSDASDVSNDLPRIHNKAEALNHQQQGCQKLRVYLDSLKNEIIEAGEAQFSERVLNLSWSVWEALKSLFEAKGLCLEVPDACPGSKDNFMYTWSKSEHYLECEIFGSGEIEFFYRNRNTEEVWGEDTTLEQRFSTDIFNKASLFLE